MSVKHLALAAGLCLPALFASGQNTAPDHLVLSELGIYAPSGWSNAPESAEFTEIYNPTNTTIDLSNYYITDYERYYDLPAIVALQTDNLLTNGSDFLLKFPDGASIPPGGTVVVTCNADSFAQAYFDKDINNFLNQAGSPQIFEIWGGVRANPTDPPLPENPAVPQMGANYNKTSADYPLDRGATAIADTGSNMSHSDGGEHCILFYWDGVGPLVQDVDAVQWLGTGELWDDSSNQWRDKSGQPGIGPPDGGGNYPTGVYATDAGFVNGHAVHVQVDYGTGPRGQLVRRSLLEAGETHTGGNGINGDDESLEEGNLTWEMIIGAPMNASPGTTDLGMSSDNMAPVVGKSTRDIQSPAPGDTVHVTVPAYDDGTITVKLWVKKGNGSYVAQTMASEGNDIYGANISTSGLAEGTRIRFYAEATDNNNVKRSEADYQARTNSTPNNVDWPGYNVFMVKSTPYAPGDFIVSEIMYNPKDHNNSWHAQYVELYNPGSTPVDISDMRLSTDDYYDDGYLMQLPSDAVIPAGGYYTISGNEVVFLRDYPGMDPDTVADFAVPPSQSFMAHAGSKFLFFDPNVFGYDDTPLDLATATAAAFKTMEYSPNAPWPTSSGTPNPSNTGYSIELSELTLAAEGDGSKWQASKRLFGTPNALNSISRTGDVAVTNVTRNVQYPTTSDAITISATVSSGTPIGTVQLFVNSGSGFGAPINMTTTDNSTYTANIGPFATDNTFVWYYIIATDTSSNTGEYPSLAPLTAIPFQVQNTLAKSGIVINEVMYDPAGGDNSTNSEFAELYNQTNAPIDLSLHVVGLNDYTMAYRWTRVLPMGTVIPANGYLLLAPRKDFLVDTYVSNYSGYQKDRWGYVDPNLVVDMAWDDSSTLSNGDGTTIFLAHPNDVDYQDLTPIVPYVALNYQVSAPWPADGETLNWNSIELKNPFLVYTDPAKWGQAVALRGTPGNENSIYEGPPANVADWTMY